MTCYCRRSLEEALPLVRSRSIGERRKYTDQLEDFKEHVRSGAYELIARHLFKAGVYYASLDNDLKKVPSMGEVLAVLRRRLVERRSLLSDFFERKRQLVETQADFVNAVDLLERILAQGPRAVGLLEGYGAKELREAEMVMDRLARLERYFSVWHVTGFEFEGEIVKVVDMHD